MILVSKSSGTLNLNWTEYDVYLASQRGACFRNNWSTNCLINLKSPLEYGKNFGRLSKTSKHLDKWDFKLLIFVFWLLLNEFTIYFKTFYDVLCATDMIYNNLMQLTKNCSIPDWLFPLQLNRHRCTFIWLNFRAKAQSFGKMHIV